MYACKLLISFSAESVIFLTIWGHCCSKRCLSLLISRESDLSLVIAFSANSEYSLNVLGVGWGGGRFNKDCCLINIVPGFSSATFLSGDTVGPLFLLLQLMGRD